MWKSITDRISGKKCTEFDETNSQKGVVFVHMSGGKGSGFRDGFAVCRSQTELTRSARSRTKQIRHQKGVVFVHMSGGKGSGFRGGELWSLGL